VKRARALALTLVALPLAYLLAWPTPIEPVSWQPPPPFPTGSTPCAVPGGLEDAVVIAPELEGPEAIYVDGDGALVTGVLDGRVLRVSPDGSRIETVGNTGGRPLGIKKLPDGRYAIADADRGLLAMAADGALESLAAGHEGVPFKFVDDLDVGSDGTVYFSDASQRFGVKDWALDILEHGRTGRILAWRPEAKATAVLVDGLSFANGVALAGDESYLAFTELNEYVLKRYWLKTEKKGTVEVIAHLPGFPDNVTYSPARDLFWVAIGSPRDPAVDRMARLPMLRHLVLRLPEALRPKPKAHTFVVGVDGSGTFRHCLQRIAPDAYAPVASAIERDGTLYFGSFRRSGIYKAPAPAAPL
jgi:sugar lactone lactonase YvrE